MKYTRLGTQFTLILLLVFLLGSALGGVVLSKTLQYRAEEKIQAEGLVLMASIKALRYYTDTEVRPLLEAQLGQDEFLPEVVPAYAARLTFERFRDTDTDRRDLRYKEAVLNPTNPDDAADPFEQTLIQAFIGDAQKTEVSGFRQVEGRGQEFYSARPIRIESESCLVCHGRVEDAPRQMVEMYGAERGFGWPLNEVVGTSIVYVPAEQVFQTARQAFSSVMAIFLGAFAIALLGLNRVLVPAVIQPVQQLAQVSRKLSQEEISAEAWQQRESQALSSLTRRRDELGQLGRTFQAMVNEVLSREARMREQIASLRIEIDQNRKQREVAEILESDYFKDLQGKAKALRRRRDGTSSPPADTDPAAGSADAPSADPPVETDQP